jgi:hypothetical protein
MSCARIEFVHEGYLHIYTLRLSLKSLKKRFYALPSDKGEKGSRVAHPKSGYSAEAFWVAEPASYTSFVSSTSSLIQLLPMSRLKALWSCL